MAARLITDDDIVHELDDEDYDNTNCFPCLEESKIKKRRISFES